MSQEIRFEKLYNLIDKIVDSLKEEIVFLNSAKDTSGLKNTFTAKKTATDILAKLVTIAAQLEKLDKNGSNQDSVVSSFSDKKIIELFLAKYKCESV